MVKLFNSSLNFRADPRNAHRFWWLILIVGLIGLYFLARLSEPDNRLAYQQLVVLFVIDSFLFLLTDRLLSRFGGLILIFLTAMEILVGLYYIINLVNITQF